MDFEKIGLVAVKMDFEKIGLVLERWLAGLGLAAGPEKSLTA